MSVCVSDTVVFYLQVDWTFTCIPSGTKLINSFSGNVTSSVSHGLLKRIRMMWRKGNVEFFFYLFIYFFG